LISNKLSLLLIKSIWLTTSWIEFLPGYSIGMIENIYSCCWSFHGGWLTWCMGT